MSDQRKTGFQYCVRKRSAFLMQASLAIALASGANVVAQTAPVAVPGQVGVEAGSESTDSDLVADQVVVTGSRIRQPNLTSEAPLQSVGEEAIERTGSILASELLTELPQFGNSLTNNNQGQATANSAFNLGVELVNLRNLGVQRTLVLVNGHRHVGGDPGTSSVDLNADRKSVV